MTRVPKALSAAAVLFALAAGAGAWALTQKARPRPVVQPIAFNHQLHLQQDIACKDCHKQVEEGLHATFPSVKACMLCHEEPKGKHPDEPKVREFAQAGGDIPWVQVNRLPGHVFFSHTAHVRFAKLACGECHGDMKQQVEPVSVPQIGHLSMARCMGCHEEKGVSIDCLRCHK